MAGAAEPGGLGGLEPPQLYQLYAVEFLLSVMFTLSLKNRPLHILRASMQAGAPRQLGHVTKIQPPQLSTRSAAPEWLRATLSMHVVILRAVWRGFVCVAKVRL